MRRRKVLQSIVALPGAAALPAAAQSPAATPANPSTQPRIVVQGAEATATGTPTFFTAAQFSALRRLCDSVIPRTANTPSATDAGVPEFLDFLIRESPPARQQLYRDGLDRLNSGTKNFAELDDAQAGRLLEPLKKNWGYLGPGDSLARFLVEARQDILQAVTSSREWSEAGSRGRRGSSGLNYYWRSLD